MHWFGSFLEGGKAVLLKGTKPEFILDVVSREKCTIVWLLVPRAQDILDAIDRGDIRLEDYDLSQWRLMHIGAQPVPPSLIARWKNKFPNHQYVAMGVMTRAAPQFNVFTFGFPLTITIGFVVLYFSMPYFIEAVKMLYEHGTSLILTLLKAQPG